MICRDYFDSDLPEQCRQLGGDVAVQVHLIAGQVFDVFRLECARDSYVLLTVIPAGGVDIGSIVSRMRSGEDEVRFDRVAVAYSQISHVLVSKARPMPAPSSLATFRPAQAESENDET